MEYLSVTVRTRWFVLIGVLVLVAGTVGAVLWVRRSRSEVGPATVVLQAATDPGSDPFVPVASSRPVAVALPPSGTVAGVTATVDADSGVRTVSGTTDRLYAGSSAGSAELYGGSGSLSACDPAAIAAFLAAHPDKAAAWAQVRGIEPDGVAGYLETLTPVVLVHDTVVTNHGFAGGAATSFGSVLQAGTAVLVDVTGLPVVRCACGNPLSAPPRVNLSEAPAQGTPWDGYAPNGVVTVVPGSSVAQFLVVDVATGQDVTVAAGPGTATPSAGSAAAGSLTPSGAPTTAGDCVLDLAWPAGAPGWIDAPGDALTCQQMIDQWRRYEQWPGDRGGSAQWVTFDDGWTCTVTLASETTSAVGRCGQSDDRRFTVYQGPPGSTTRVSPTPTPTPTPAPTPTAGATASGPSATATTPQSSGESTADGTGDLLITPSGNIECALKDGQFACTIKEFNGDLGETRCPGEQGLIVRMDATGPAHGSDCRGDFFAGISWPEPTPYGTTTTFGDVTCDVEETGVTCTNLDGHTFTLSRAGLR